MDHDTEYITADQAAERLRVSPRQVHRYGEGARARLRTRKAGRRLLFHAGDVDTLAHDMDVAHKPPPQPPALRILPTGEVLDYLKAKDEQIDALRGEIADLRQQLGQLQGAMQAQQLLFDKEMQLKLLESRQQWEQEQQPGDETSSDTDEPKGWRWPWQKR